MQVYLFIQRRQLARYTIGEIQKLILKMNEENREDTRLQIISKLQVMYKTISAGRITELQEFKANIGESQGASVPSTGLEINYTQAVTRLSLFRFTIFIYSITSQVLHLYKFYTCLCVYSKGI